MRKLTAKEQQRIARDYFEHWFDRATGFFRQYQHAVDNGDLKTTIFDLHQSSESCYKATILVFTNYNPNEHFLSALSQMVMDHHSDFINIFRKKQRQIKNVLNCWIMPT